MSSAVISTSAAQGRFFILDDEVAPEGGTRLNRAGRDFPSTISTAEILQSKIRNQKSAISLAPASQFAVRPTPSMVSSGITDIDTLTGGLPRGCLAEICGPTSSGRTTFLMAAIAAALRRGEICALVDASDAFDPQSLAAADVDLNRLLWVRCGEAVSPRSRESAAREKETISLERSLEQLLRATDLLIESGGFGLIVLDLCDLPPQTARKIPLATWFRFRRAVEHTPTVLLVIERQSIAGSCSSLLMKLSAAGKRLLNQPSDSPISKPGHAQLFAGLEITAEVVRSRLEGKPAASVCATFSSQAARAG